MADTVPSPASGIELLGQAGGSGYRRPPSLVRRADGQTIQLTPLLYRVLEQIDGRHSYGQIAASVSEREGRLVAPEDVHWLTETKLRPLRLLRRADGSEPTVKKASPLLSLGFRKVVTTPGSPGASPGRSPGCSDRSWSSPCWPCSR